MSKLKNADHKLEIELFSPAKLAEWHFNVHGENNNPYNTNYKLQEDTMARLYRSLSYVWSDPVLGANEAILDSCMLTMLTQELKVRAARSAYQAYEQAYDMCEIDELKRG